MGTAISRSSAVKKPQQIPALLSLDLLSAEVTVLKRGLNCGPSAAVGITARERGATVAPVAALSFHPFNGLRERVLTIWGSLAAIRHPRRSVTGKLMAVVLLTTAIALLVAGTTLLATDIRQDRRAWGDNLQSTADILALMTAPALAFDDRASADRNLAALAAWCVVRTLPER
jgi:hypothetical protein